MKANEKVQDLGDGAFLVAVPVYFTVMLDQDGNVRSVQQNNSDRKWVKNGHNKFGNGYGKNPTGLMADAARLARLAATSS
jgi:hypothetical protein